jgi:predicted TIM-barrel fold metal-dependent hydrolase
MGEDRIVFGSDYCGGLGLLKKGVAVIDQQPDPARIKKITEQTSRNLLRL